jgi:hypothetical protein
MSVHELKTRQLLARSLIRIGRSVASTALAGTLGASMLQSCSASSGGGSSPGAGGSSNGGTNNTGGGSRGGSSGSSAGNGGSSAGNGGSFAGTGGGAAGTGGSSPGGGGSAGTGGSTAGTGGSTVGTGGAPGTGGSVGPRDGGGPDGAIGLDASACRNTDLTAINIDSGGRVCNNQWGIQGAWYCYTSPQTTSTAASGAPACPANTTGIIPFNATSNAICMSGTTGGSADGADFGAGVGFELNNLVADPALKNTFNATTKNVIGFAITVTGTSGGSVLNINFPQKPSLFATGKAAAVTVPGPAGASTTYNVLLAQAIVGDNGMGISPPPVFNPSALTDVQVAIPGADGVRHQYNLCVTRVVPLMAAPAAPAAFGNYGALFGEGKQIFIEGMGPYAIQNDPVTVGANVVNMQAMYGAGNVGFSATPTFTSGGVGAYPSILMGWVQGGYYVGGGAPGAYLGG